MKKQNELFKQVRKRFPKHTYRQLSELFGVSNTRIFRLMNGSELRASEYFRIKEKLEEDSSEVTRLIKFLEGHSLKLSRGDCTEIVNELKAKFYIRQVSER